jgi:hypothetical protein
MDRPFPREAAYLRDLAERLFDGRLDLDRLQDRDDEAVRTELMQVKGVGRIQRRRCPDVRPAPAGHLARRQPSSPACRRASLGAQRACVARRHRRDRRPLPALENARRPLSLVDPIAARRRAGHTAANHRGNDRVRWSQLRPYRAIGFPETRPADPTLDPWPWVQTGSRCSNTGLRG